MRLALVTLALGALLAAPAPLGSQTLVQVTKNGSGRQDQYPVISDDGQIFAWCGTDPATSRNQVWVADLATLTVKKLTSGNGLPIPYSLAISGDGSTIVYMEGSNLWAISSAGGTPKQVTAYSGTKRVRTSGVSVSHDGRLACYVTYDSASRLYDVEVVDTSTSQVTNITKSTTTDYCTCCISGDGKTVAFTANRGQPADQVWLANADGTNLRALTSFKSGNAFWPRLDRRATVCAFESSQSGQYEVYTIRTDGTSLTDVSRNPGGQDRRVWLAADGDRVTWKSDRGGLKDVYMAYPDGTGSRKLTPFGDMSPSLTNNSHSLNGDGTVAVFASRVNYKGGNPERDWEIYVFKDGITRTGKATPGATIALNLEDPTVPGAVYLVRCAMSRSPGIVIPGVGTVPLTPDALFWLSGQVKTIFQNFEGTLNAQGQGAAAVNIPNVPALIGFAFYASFVTASPGLAVYNPVLVTIE